MENFNSRSKMEKYALKLQRAKSPKEAQMYQDKLQQYKIINQAGGGKYDALIGQLDKKMDGVDTQATAAGGNADALYKQYLALLQAEEKRLKDVADTAEREQLAGTARLKAREKEQKETVAEMAYLVARLGYAEAMVELAAANATFRNAEQNETAKDYEARRGKAVQAAKAKVTAAMEALEALKSDEMGDEAKKSLGAFMQSLGAFMQKLQQQAQQPTQQTTKDVPSTSGNASP